MFCHGYSDGGTPDLYRVSKNLLTNIVLDALYIYNLVTAWKGSILVSVYFHADSVQIILAYLTMDVIYPYAEV